ncbi:MAG: hypothetical protein WC248_06830 [Candidatus Methanomethylophilaceae archaeon]|jgi:hypothetical protein
MLSEIALIILILLYPISLYKAFILGSAYGKEPVIKPKKRKKQQKQKQSDFAKRMKAIDDFDPMGV